MGTNSTKAAANGLWLCLGWLALPLGCGDSTGSAAEGDTSREPPGVVAAVLPPAISREGMEPWVAEQFARARDAVEAQPDSAAAWFRYAKVLHAHRKTAAAIVAYERVTDLEPKQATAHYLQARALQEEGREEALLAFEACLALRPGDGPARLAYGEALLVWGREEEAFAALSQVAEEQLDLLSYAALGLAQIEDGNGRLESAIGWLERAAKQAPGHGQVQAVLAGLLQRAGREEEARSALQKSRSLPRRYLRRDPWYSSMQELCVSNAILTGRAADLYRNGREEEAAQLWRQVVQRDPAHLGALTPLSYRLVREGQSEEARRLWRACVEADASLAEAWVMLARRDAAVREPRAAVEHLREAALRDPSLDALRDTVVELPTPQVKNLFRQLDQAGGRRQALTLARAILAKDPAQVEVEEQLLWLSVSGPEGPGEGRAESEVAIDRALQSWGAERPRMWLAKAICAAARGDLPAAVSAAEKAQEQARGEASGGIQRSIKKRLETYRKRLDRDEETESSVEEGR